MSDNDGIIIAGGNAGTELLTVMGLKVLFRCDKDICRRVQTQELRSPLFGQMVRNHKDAVQAECGKLPDESLIEDYLKNGTANTSNRILSVMRMEAEKYTAEIFDKLSEYEYDSEMVKLHIIGGGGCLVQNFGIYDVDSVEIISDICATAKGYESLYLTQVRMRKGA